MLFAIGGVWSILHMEQVDVARNSERELSEIERQFSLIPPPVTELTYIGVGQPTGASVNSVEDSFRISGNGL